jgi:hypothetical protein
MPVIKARTRGKHLVCHITRLDRESYETLFVYAAFPGEPPEYVLNQLIDTVLAKDREFLAWRGAHPGSHAPRAASRRPRHRPRRHNCGRLGRPFAKRAGVGALIQNAEAGKDSPGAR